MFSIDFFIRGVLHDMEIDHDQITEDLVRQIRARFNPEALRPQKDDIVTIYNSLQPAAEATEPAENELTPEPAAPVTPAMEMAEVPLPDVAETASEPAIIHGEISDEEKATVDEPVVPEVSAVETAAENVEAATVTPVEDGNLAATTPAPTAGLPQQPAETPPAAPHPPQPAPITPPKTEPAPVQKIMHLPNAKEKEFYSITVNWAQLGISNIGEHRIEGLAPLGLSYDEELRMIDGTPTKAGEHELKLHFRYKGDGPGKPEMIRIINLFVNYDPRSLWTEHEPEAGSPYWKAHTDTKLVTNGQKVMVAASKRGRSHAKDAKFREDDADIFYNDVNQWHLMAVSDGAGSAKLSRKGSQLACNTVIEFLNSDYAKDILAKGEPLITACHSQPDDTAARKAVGDMLYQTLCAAVVKAYAAIEKEALAANAPIKDFSATLLVSMCKKFDFGWFVGGFWIGDGGIGIYNKNGEPVLLGAPDSGEYSGQTRFITMPEVRTAEGLYGRLRFKIVPDFDALVLMSDGITDAWFHTDNNLQRKAKWDELFQEIEKTVALKKDNPDIHTQLLAWLDFWVKGEYDDRTIAIMF